MILGFTGTRGGWTKVQREVIRQCLGALPELVLHGGAEGSDEEFDVLLREAGMPGAGIAIYAMAHRMEFWQARIPAADLVLTRSEWAPLSRNKFIAKECDHLLVTPFEMEEVLRSGTWATVRYARSFGKPITIILPDGSIVEESAKEIPPPVPVVKAEKRPPRPRRPRRVRRSSAS